MEIIRVGTTDPAHLQLKFFVLCRFSMSQVNTTITTCTGFKGLHFSGLVDCFSTSHVFQIELLKFILGDLFALSRRSSVISLYTSAHSHVNA